MLPYDVNMMSRSECSPSTLFFSEVNIAFSALLASFDSSVWLPKVDVILVRPRKVMSTFTVFYICTSTEYVVKVARTVQSSAGSPRQAIIS